MLRSPVLLVNLETERGVQSQVHGPRFLLTTPMICSTSTASLACVALLKRKNVSTPNRKTCLPLTSRSSFTCQNGPGAFPCGVTYVELLRGGGRDWGRDEATCARCRTVSLINPRRACTGGLRYLSCLFVCLFVCLSVCLLPLNRGHRSFLRST